MKKAMIVAAALGLAPIAASAQFVDSLKIEPAEITAGESVKITVGFEVQGAANCGLRLHFGDGNTQDYKINQEKDIPLVVSRAYAKAGSYEIKAEPKTVGMSIKCGGKNQSGMLKVAAAPSARAAAAAKPAPAAAMPEGPACPEGWQLDRKSVNKKTGAFTCRAKAGTAAPQAKLACPGDLGYFENVKKGRLGCQP